MEKYLIIPCKNIWLSPQRVRAGCRVRAAVLPHQPGHLLVLPAGGLPRLCAARHALHDLPHRHGGSRQPLARQEAQPRGQVALVSTS